MKAICLAAAMTIVLLCAVTLAFRLGSRRRRARQMMVLYLGCVVPLIGLWSITPHDLGFLHRSLLAEPPWFDLLLLLFFFSAAFFGGVLQLYNLTDRGFSLRILIDALEHPDGAVSIDQLMTGYGGGRGVAWMYDKRMQGLLDGDFVRRMDDSVVLAPRGAFIADVFARIRRFLRLGPA